MNVTAKTSFFHRTEFNVWLITAFFTFVINGLVIIPLVVGIHAVGGAVDDELCRYRTPAPTIEVPVPDRRVTEGTPVALRAPRTGT